MEQRDILKDQIEQLGKVLGKILADFLGLKSSGEVSQAIEAANERLESQLDIKAEKLKTLDRSALKEYLKERELTADHLEILSEYVQEVGLEEIKISQQNGRIWLLKAIEILDIADEVSRTMSFNRMNKKSRIENLLD